MVFSMDCCLDLRTFGWPDYNHCWSIARHLTCKVTLFCHTVVWPLVTNTGFRSLWLKASRLKLAAKAVEQGGSRRLLKEKKFSPGRRA